MIFGADGGVCRHVISAQGRGSDVVGQGVSPGTDESEAEFGGAGHEKKLGPFALKFEVRESFSGH